MIPWLAQAAVLQDRPETLTVLSPAGGVKVSFLAGLTIGCIEPPSEALKALVCFEDGDLPQLAEMDRNTLLEAVLGVGELPKAQRCSDRILPGP